MQNLTLWGTYPLTHFPATYNFPVAKVLWPEAIKDFDTNVQHGHVESVDPSVRLVHIRTSSLWRYGRTHHTPHEHTYYIYWAGLHNLCKCLRHTRYSPMWNQSYVTTLIVHLSQEERSKCKQWSHSLRDMGAPITTAGMGWWASTRYGGRILPLHTNDALECFNKLLFT